jgi:serine/threonine protein kinase
MQFDETVPPGQSSAPPAEPGGPRDTAAGAPDLDSEHTPTVDEARIAAEERDGGDDDMDAGETRLDSRPEDDVEDDHTIGVAEVLSGGTAGQASAPPQDLESDGTVVLDHDEEGATAPPRAPARAKAPRQGGPLKVGESFGTRYRIDVLLGIGGMGAVYKAWDRELDIPVALKVIRPEIAGDERASAEISRRFKRELLLARKVTHKNVVRIHDLGDIDGIKYITMTFIEGDTLAWLLKGEGSLPVPEALRIWRYIVSGMLEAHKAGVVHRDLKPANVMIDNATGEAHLMDFGIARSDTSAEEAAEGGAEGGAPVSRLIGGDETKVGEIIGTVQYMPPEQFFGKKVDQRADIYAMGLIFYDMLLGPRRAQSANSALAEIKGRLKEAPPSPITIDPSVPEDLDRIISKCLEPDPDERYQTTAELAADLDRLDDEGNPLPVSRLLTRRMVIAAIGAVVLLIAGTWFMASRRAPPTEREPISVLIADFDNQTGDASFEGAVEQALTIAMEGAAFITAYPRPNAQRIAEQLQPGSKLDETTTRLVSRREGVSVILAGTIASEGDGYALSVRALDPGLEPDEGKPIARQGGRAGGGGRDRHRPARGPR